MSDQDFFFDDEPEAKKPSAKEGEKKAAGQKPKQGQKSAAPAKNGAKKPVQKAKVQEVEATEAEGLTFTLSIVILIAIVALLVGLIGGVLIGKSLTPGVVYTQEDLGTGTTAPQGMGGTMGTGGTAPTLSDEQLQGGMPAGHPTVDDTKAETPATETGK